MMEQTPTPIQDKPVVAVVKPPRLPDGIFQEYSDAIYQLRYMDKLVFGRFVGRWTYFHSDLPKDDDRVQQVLAEISRKMAYFSRKAGVDVVVEVK